MTTEDRIVAIAQDVIAEVRASCAVEVAAFVAERDAARRDATDSQAECARLRTDFSRETRRADSAEAREKAANERANTAELRASAAEARPTTVVQGAAVPATKPDLREITTAIEHSRVDIMRAMPKAVIYEGIEAVRDTNGLLARWKFKRKEA